jgi:GT2 family glycosyltransferase
LVLVEDCLRHLTLALEQAGCPDAQVFLIDNGPPNYSSELAACLAESATMRSLIRLSGHGNLGYGAGNNLAIVRGDSQYHLVLNPDVDLAPESLAIGLEWLEDHPGDSLVGARTFDSDGTEVAICKDYPSVIVLALRAIDINWLNRTFSSALARYDSEHCVVGPDGAREVRHLSGSFMLGRTRQLREVGAFDQRYFLYFEDFDLSRRMARLGRVVQLDRLRVWHHGGAAARKGWSHVRMFATSAARYFSSYGWKLI